MTCRCTFMSAEILELYKREIYSIIKLVEIIERGTRNVFNCGNIYVKNWYLCHLSSYSYQYSVQEIVYLCACVCVWKRQKYYFPRHKTMFAWIKSLPRGAKVNTCGGYTTTRAAGGTKYWNQMINPNPTNTSARSRLRSM